MATETVNPVVATDQDGSGAGDSEAGEPGMSAADTSRHLDEVLARARPSSVYEAVKISFEDEGAEKAVAEHGCRERFGKVLGSGRVHFAVVCLVLLDVLLVISEVILDLHLCSLRTHEHDNHEAIESTKHTIHILHLCSIAILGVFLFEILLKLIAYDVAFFRKPGEVFDALLVSISFALDLKLTGEAATVVEMLLLLRLWRVTRIVHGAMMSVFQHSEKLIHAERKKRKEIERELHNLKVQFGVIRG